MQDDPRVRIGHCVPDAPPVRVSVDGSTAFDEVTFGDLTDYAKLAAGKHSVSVAPATGGDAVIETDVELESETMYTVLAAGMLDSIEPIILMDEPGDVPTDKAHVRIIHCSPDAPSVTISTADGVELFTDLEFGSASDYRPVDAGQFDLEVRPTGEETVVLELPDLTFSGGSAYTAIAYGQVSDDSLTALLVEDAMAPITADD